MRPSCPACGEPIGAEQMNIGEGVAVCAGCGGVHRLSTLAGTTPAAGAPIDDDAPLDPVAGTWIRGDERATLIGAQVRSPANIALGGFLVVFAVAWNGGVATFIGFAVAAMSQWLRGGPAPGSGSGPPGMPAAFGAFMLVFMIPFVAAGIAVAGLAAYALLGRVEFSIGGAEGSVFRGVGPLGRRVRFDPMRVTSVGTKIELDRDSSGDLRIEKRLVIEADRTIKVGTMLSDDRRTFLERALRRALLAREG